jgi:hypothetical protein
MKKTQKWMNFQDLLEVWANWKMEQGMCHTIIALPFTLKTYL